MISYQDLCQQHKQFQHSRKGYQQILNKEINHFKTQLARTLGLENKHYARSVAEEITEPYVFVANQQGHLDEADFPLCVFDVTLMLEDEPNSYPKYPFTQTLKVSFIQADRLRFSFVKNRPELSFIVNRDDDNEVKYRQMVEAYLQLLMKRLSHEGKSK